MYRKRTKTILLHGDSTRSNKNSNIVEQNDKILRSKIIYRSVYLQVNNGLIDNLYDFISFEWNACWFVFRLFGQFQQQHHTIREYTYEDVSLFLR